MNRGRGSSRTDLSAWIAATLLSCGGRDELRISRAVHDAGDDPRAVGSGGAAGSPIRGTGGRAGLGGRDAGAAGRVAASPDASVGGTTAFPDAAPREAAGPAEDADAGVTDADAGFVDASPPHDPLVGSWMLLGTVGERARLDLREIGAGYEALITPLHLPAAPFDVVVTDSHVELTGSVTLLDYSCGGIAPLSARTWTSVRIPRAPDGSLLSPPSFTGAYDPAISGDPCCRVIDDLGLPTDPRLDADAVRPALHIEHASLARSGGWLLPWDSFTVGASEGVSGSALLNAPSMTLGTADAAAVGYAWSVDASLLEGSWDAVRRVRGTALEWERLVGASATLVVPAGRVVDPSGNPSTPFRSRPLPFADVGPAHTALDFDQEEALWLWGAAQVAAGTPDSALCESGGCAVVGQFPLGGMAGRLDGSSARELVVRYRVLLGGNYPDTNAGPIWPAVLEIARPGGSVVSHRLGYGPLTNLGALGWASEWTTMAFALPADVAGSEIGFRLGSEVVPESVECMAGILARVVIESMTTR